MSLTIFAAGVVGALSREAFRWRTLYLSRKLASYLRPIYIAIAAVIVGLAGSTALIFVGMLSPEPKFELPLAFVIGVGFELVVKKATSLQMPAVPMGNDSTARKDSVWEFLYV